MTLPLHRRAPRAKRDRSTFHPASSSLGMTQETQFNCNESDTAPRADAVIAASMTTRRRREWYQVIELSQKFHR